MDWILWAASLEPGTPPLASQCDWDEILALSQEHRISPKFYKLLKRFPEQVPEPVLKLLSKRVKFTTLRGLVLTSSLLKVSKALAASEVPAVFYKGPILAKKLYGDIGMRQFVDIDFLVSKSDMPATQTVLSKLGFSSSEVPNAKLSSYLRWECEMTFECPHRRTSLEPHWRLLPKRESRALDTRELIENACKFDWNGQSVLALCPEDRLLCLADHGAKHLWLRVGWIVDIAQLITTDETIDWEAVLERSQRLGLKRRLCLALLLAQNLGARLEDSVLSEVQKDRWAPLIADWIWRDMRQPTSRRVEERHFLIPLVFSLICKERWSDRLHCLFLKAFSPRGRDLLESSIPAHWDFLHFLARPVRWFLRRSERAERVN